MKRLLWGALWFLGVCREERDAKFIQRIWLLAGPPLAAFFALECEGPPLASWALLGILALDFFWDGLRGWEWGQRWVRRIAWYIFCVIMGLGVSSWELRPAWPNSLALAAAFPLLWPITVMGWAQDFLYGSGTGAILAILGVWFLLLLANWAGRREQQRRSR